MGVCPLFLFRADFRARTWRRETGATSSIEIVGPIAEPRGRARYGLEIFDVQFRREAQRHGAAGADRSARARRRRAEESVSVEDCAQVSRDLSAILDVEDVVPDRRTRWRFRRRGSIGRCGTRATTGGSRAGWRRSCVREAVDGQRLLQGPARRASTATTCCSSTADDGRRHRVPLGVITRANLEVEF